MFFNSFTFAVFLTVVFFLHLFIFSKTTKLRNIFFLIVSYFFYGYWNWKLLGLIAGITAIDFFLAKHMSNADNKKPYVIAALIANLGVLFFFKYCNFFLESFYSLIHWNDTDGVFTPLNIILPVGISFYTFQGLGYVIDVYKGKIESSKDPVAFFAFISFFPQLVAGPIERAGDLLPQFDKKYEFNYDDVRKGLLEIAWGLFKKVVIADRIAIYVDSVYSDPSVVGGKAMVVVLIFFAFQLYLDFSAYSGIAVGIARMFGFKLHQNFLSPYTAVTVREFWARWHVTLTSWFRDYLYIWLGGNRCSKWRCWLNVLIVFVVSGLWHGASWNFVIWGFINGFFMVVLDRIIKWNPTNVPIKVVSWGITMSIWTISLIFFRSSTFADAITVFHNLFASSTDIFEHGLNDKNFYFTIYCLVGLMSVEFVFKMWGEKIEMWFYEKSPFFIRWTLYFIIPLSVLYLGIYGDGNDNNFIYFQF